MNRRIDGKQRLQAIDGPQSVVRADEGFTDELFMSVSSLLTRFGHW